MHSYNRTLLAKLGFADPDRSEPRHDMACRYLAEDAQARALVTLARPVPVFPKGDPPVVFNRGRTYTYDEAFAARLDCARTSFSNMVLNISGRSLEEPINKGSGAYKTTVVFLDVAIKYRYGYTETTYGLRCGEEFSEARGAHFGEARVLVEVKIAPVDASAILRQVRLYQEYESFTSSYGSSWLVATAFDLPRSATAVLLEHGIRPIRLGAKLPRGARSSVDERPTQPRVEEV